MVKVCHVAVNDLWAGAEVHLAVLLRCLARTEGVAVYAVLFNEGRLADILRASGIPVTIIPEIRFNCARIAIELVYYFRKHRFQIVHTHKPKDSVPVAIAGKIAGIPYLVRTYHGLPEPHIGYHHHKNAIYTAVDNFVNRYMTDRIIAVSSNIQRHLLSLKYPEQHILQIHNGIDLDNIHCYDETAADNRKELIIGTASRLVPVKGHDTLLRAISTLKARHKDIRLIIVGDGPLRGKLERLIQELELKDEVILTGHSDNIYVELRKMDIFALPSIHEGIPMVLLEAMALSLPIVASRVGGIPEVICHDESGILIEPGNADALASALTILARDRTYARRLGKAARKKVEENFSAELMATRTAKLYRELV
jgi:glycosyltransferase involved in cell wall biosynthesis